MPPVLPHPLPLVKSSTPEADRGEVSVTPYSTSTQRHVSQQYGMIWITAQKAYIYRLEEVCQWAREYTCMHCDEFQGGTKLNDTSLYRFGYCNYLQMYVCQEEKLDIADRFYSHLGLWQGISMPFSYDQTLISVACCCICLTFQCASRFTTFLGVI